MSSAGDIKRIELEQEPIWTIQFDETITQYRAFCLYRDLLGARSLSRVAEALAKERHGTEPVPKAERLTPKQAPGVIKEWSARNRWVERADAYELHLEEERRQERETEIMRMERRERQLANTAIAGVMRRVMGYEDKEDPARSVEAMDWSKLTPGEVAQLAKVFVEISRLATNRPTSLARNALAIMPRDYEAAVNGLIEIFMRHVVPERRAAAAEEVNAFLADGATG
jgi:hypothetical protein